MQQVCFRFAHSTFTRGCDKEAKNWCHGFGLLPGSQCRVWNEQIAKWVQGKVVAVADEARIVREDL